ncbi:UDP-N-acetylmuramyl peptide synthase [Enemella dayhoffiae]|uniref:Lipid II isoglutaminyl synthase (glutamine-hydrolyzing) subunit MurT n=1 Tax=Enemella dayhoffiae TaxID=2016507 RepID=A0A255GYW2_9ACTN|nr:MurT ligase domain-containing protein [Enemella dayhoffiae]OYO20865.1 UDP-N-acetylmuramyl peptide synthase [Enemella dayhoffiae]
MPADLSAPAPPAPRRTPLQQVRLSAGLLAGEAAALASRVARRGSGASIRGRVLTRVDPQALAKLLPGRRIAVVSGTNGKTTTTHLLAAAVRQGLGSSASRMVTNADGANLHHGIASALGRAPKADIAVLETDERVVADVVRLGHPEVLVLLNFSRDQLDRHHEIKSLGTAWLRALMTAGADGPVVVANATEPLIVWAARHAKQVVWVDTQNLWHADSVLCPECGSTLVTEASTGSAGGRWRCTGCDLAQPEATWRVVDGRIVDPAGVSHDPQLHVPGAFNVSNAACALAAAAVLGVPVETALTGMRTVTSPAGRFATTKFGDTTARLLLAKNPAGWAEALPIMATDTVVLAIDSVAADGKDVSWLWDVDFEQLAGKQVVASGPRAHDLAIRLKYAEVEHRVEPDLARALSGHPDPVDVIATYTPFQKLRKLGGLA